MALLPTLKVLYKESIDTVDKWLIKPATKYIDGNGFNFAIVTFTSNCQGKHSYKGFTLVRNVLLRACGRLYT